VLPCATTCPTVPDLTSLLMRAPVLPRVPRLRTSSPCRGRLRYCHVSRGLQIRLPAEEGSSAVTRPAVPDPASPLRRAPVLPRVSQLNVSRGAQA
jgi:hypothetical protein